MLYFQNFLNIFVFFVIEYPWKYSPIFLTEKMFK
jgi:hypothetical protein